MGKNVVHCDGFINTKLNYDNSMTSNDYTHVPSIKKNFQKMPNETVNGILFQPFHDFKIRLE